MNCFDLKVHLGHAQARNLRFARDVSCAEVRNRLTNLECIDGSHKLRVFVLTHAGIGRLTVHFTLS